MKLTTAIEYQQAAGTYNYKVVIGTGTAVLNYQVEYEGFLEVPSTSVSASTGVSVELPSCRVTATLTGDAQVYLNRVE